MNLLCLSRRVGGELGGCVEVAVDLAGEVALELSRSSPGGELLLCVVADWVVGDVSCPAGPDHSDPAAGEDTDGVGVSGAA
jgi:hypothetical protein